MSSAIYRAAKRPAASMESPASPSTNKPGSPHVLIEWQDLLSWQRDNEYILTGYRQASYSLTRSAQSILRLHNESVNIWSHLIGTLLFSLGPLYIYYKVTSRYVYVTEADKFAVFTYFASVSACFLLSSSFHALMNHSPRMAYFMSQLDHLGIVLVIWGSTIPSAHFGFYCNAHLQSRYWYLATAVGVLCAIATFHPMFRTPAGRKIRVLLYMLLGLSSFIPAVHGVVLNGYVEYDRRMGLSRFIGLGIIQGTGAAIYGARIPERWYPKRFDIFGSSHQIMHILVMGGAWCYGVGLIRAFDYWHGLNVDGKDACH